MRKTLVALVVVACALVTATGAGAVATPPFQVVMSGLDNPRGLAWGPQGALYVAEAGRGGTQPCFATPEGSGFGGLTGAVSRLWRGVQERVVSGLPSHADPAGFGATGPHDVAMLGLGNARVMIGLGTDPANRATGCGPIGPLFGWTARVLPNGTWRLETDVAAHERAANPDGGIFDSNPYGLLATPGATLATDAGGNHLVRIAANGSVSTLAVFPSRSNSTRGTDSVPTAVAVGPDGAYYVGELTGFVPGEAKVWRVIPGQAPTVYQAGFMTIIDIAFGPDGTLYVLEFATGNLWRVPAVGARTLVASGLVAPGSVTLGSDGAFYVSNCAVFPGNIPSPCGQGGTVVRIPG